MMRYLNCLDLQFGNESLCWTNATGKSVYCSARVDQRLGILILLTVLDIAAHTLPIARAKIAANVLQWTLYSEGGSYSLEYESISTCRSS